MDRKNYFKDLLGSIPDFRKIVLLLFLFQNDKDLIRKIGFSEQDIKRLNLDFKNILIEQQEEDLAYVKNEEESVLERFLNQ